VINTIVPSPLNDYVGQFCLGISTADPVYVPIRRTWWAKKSECFPNVERMIKSKGGTLETGWQIWEWPDVFIEAEFHGIWISPVGERRDITPKPKRFPNILFLPDTQRQYQGRQVDNIREPLQDDRVIKDFLAVRAAIFLVLNKGDRANQNGVVSIPPQEIKPLMIANDFLYAMLRAGLREQDECGCQRGEIYKQCCGTVIAELLEQQAN